MDGRRQPGWGSVRTRARACHPSRAKVPLAQMARYGRLGRPGRQGQCIEVSVPVPVLPVTRHGAARAGPARVTLSQ